ncbi:hypothetical protein HHL17_15355 [Chitinophaga sp. G-6-1-13]|uniref:Uncharacterized protein n=1 Tax=Chitinophaga fulva TaxID=2728842 RepID=A0A848GJK7_9BACT|nr:hypothetical protein [Chitinophaga fulva]NML38584.1 hypothetical protein [Chitinophaga fulva]
MTLLFKKMLCAGVIAVFPLFMAALMTYRFLDPIPLLYNWWLGAMFVWSAVFYMMISPLFYGKYPFVFRCLIWVGILCSLAGWAAWGYYYLYAPADETLLYTGFDRVFIRVNEFVSVDSWCWKMY